MNDEELRAYLCINAIFSGDWDKAHQLLDEGIDYKFDRNGFSVLHAIAVPRDENGAISDEHRAFAFRLISEADIPLVIMDLHGRTPLDLAYELGATQMAEVFKRFEGSDARPEPLPF